MKKISSKQVRKRKWKAIYRTGVRRNKYFVSKDGLVIKKNASGEWVALTQSKLGPYQYRYVHINKRFTSVQRLVMEAFGKLEKGKLVHHEDYDTANNKFKNLQSITRREHQIEHLGFPCYAKRNGQVIHAAGAMTELADKIGCSTATVYSCFRGWSRTAKGFQIEVKRRNKRRSLDVVQGSNR